MTHKSMSYQLPSAPSATARLISELLETADIADAQYFGREFATQDAAMVAGENLLANADRIVAAGNLTVEKAKSAMRRYGSSRGIARQYSISKEVANIHARYGQLLRSVIVPNRDEARKKASEILEQVSESYLSEGNRQGAGIELTNAALCLLEMSDQPPPILRKARQQLERSLGLKTDLFDKAFSRFNLALCFRLMAQGQSDDQAYLNRAARYLDRAASEFAESHTPAGLEVSLPLNMSQIVRGLLRSLRRCQTELLTKGYRNQIHEIYQSTFDSNPTMILNGIANNPQAYGMASVPAWATPDIDVSEHALRYDRAHDALSTAIQSCHGFDRARLRWERHHLNGTYSNRWDIDDDAIQALKSIWDIRDYHTYFDWSRKLIAIEPSGQAIGSYVEILKNLASCVIQFRMAWTEEDLEHLLIKNDTTFRFLACKLTAYSEIKIAFDLLEATRGLISSKTLRIMDEPISGNGSLVDSCSWVHLSHSPDATVVVGMNEVGGKQHYFGRTFPDLSGRTLAVKFSSLLEPGLLVAQQANNRTAASQAADNISVAMKPVVGYIDDNSTCQDLRILPGGYFQAFPVASVETALGAALNTKRRSALAPSRVLAIKTDTPAALKEPILVVSADAVPGCQTLKYSALDRSAIENYFRTTEVAANPVDIRNLECKPGSALHFTGHSVADPDPAKSRVFLYGGVLTAFDILETGPKPDFCVLSSCQSGAAHNFQAQDEFLSLQTAFLYAGSSVTVGTAWPVGDFAAFCFTERLYSELALRASADIASWIHAFWASQAWLRNVQLDELRSLIKRVSAVIELPPALAQREGAFKPFAAFYDWAAFNIVARL